MWIVDSDLKNLEQQNRPIRVGIIGAGFMGQGLTNQIVHSVPGMRVVARNACVYAGKITCIVVP